MNTRKARRTRRTPPITFYACRSTPPSTSAVAPRWRLSYRRDHEAFGFDLTRGLADQLDEPVAFDEFALRGSFRYGVVDARGNLEAGVRVRSRSYANLEEITDGRDFDTVAPYGLFSYRLSGDTRALLELRYDGCHPRVGTGRSGELSLFGGLEFAATGRFRGAARLGVTNSRYDDEARDSETLFVSETRVDYLIREYITLGLSYERELDDVGTRREDGSTARQTIADELRLTWAQDWSSRISHLAYLARGQRDRACPDPTTTRLIGGLEIDYALRRWLDFGLSVEAERRDGDRCEGDASEPLEFDQLLYGAYVRVSL